MIRAVLLVLAHSLNLLLDFVDLVDIKTQEFLNRISKCLGDEPSTWLLGWQKLLELSKMHEQSANFHELCNSLFQTFGCHARSMARGWVECVNSHAWIETELQQRRMKFEHVVWGNTDQKVIHCFYELAGSDSSWLRWIMFFVCLCKSVFFVESDQTSFRRFHQKGVHFLVLPKSLNQQMLLACLRLVIISKPFLVKVVR